jgi:hypothetical protein
VASSVSAEPERAVPFQRQVGREAADVVVFLNLRRGHFVPRRGGGFGREFLLPVRIQRFFTVRLGFASAPPFVDGSL